MVKSDTGVMSFAPPSDQEEFPFEDFPFEDFQDIFPNLDLPDFPVSLPEIPVVRETFADRFWNWVENDFKPPNEVFEDKIKSKTMEKRRVKQILKLMLHSKNNPVRALGESVFHQHAPKILESLNCMDGINLCNVRFSDDFNAYDSDFDVKEWKKVCENHVLKKCYDDRTSRVVRICKIYEQGEDSAEEDSAEEDFPEENSEDGGIKFPIINESSEDSILEEIGHEVMYYHSIVEQHSLRDIEIELCSFPHHYGRNRKHSVHQTSLTLCAVRKNKNILQWATFSIHFQAFDSKIFYTSSDKEFAIDFTAEEKGKILNFFKSVFRRMRAQSRDIYDRIDCTSVSDFITILLVSCFKYFARMEKQIWTSWEDDSKPPTWFPDEDDEVTPGNWCVEPPQDDALYSIAEGDIVPHHFMITASLDVRNPIDNATENIKEAYYQIKKPHPEGWKKLG